jgi:acetyl-CoA C-acetyltransferase
MRPDPRSPVVVGVAQRTWHPGPEPAPAPLVLWETVARAAADDAGRSGVLDQVQGVNVVHCATWEYDDPAARLAERLGAPAGPRDTSSLAGTAHQQMIDVAAERILAGDTDVELVVGGEALWTVRTYARAGETPPWDLGTAPVGPPIDLQAWYLPTELAHGVIPAWLTFALLDDARRHHLGITPADHQAQMGRDLEAMARVAAASPYAWRPTARSAAEITTPAPDNRWVATPYTKRMVAVPDVDMAAATIVTSAAAADRLGVPEDRRVHLRAWGYGQDSAHLAARDDLHRSLAMQTVFADTFRRAGLTLDDIGVIDLYSCFPSSIDFARDALGLAADDPRGVTATGGLPFHGAPSANYVGHSVAAVVERIRAGAGAGLVTGVGMHMTKHVAAVYADRPGPVLAPDPALEAGLAARPERTVVATVDGTVTVAAQTVVHDRTGAPTTAIVIGTGADGTRGYARTEDPGVIADMLAAPWTGREVAVVPDGTTNRIVAPAR